MLTQFQEPHEYKVSTVDGPRRHLSTNVDVNPLNLFFTINGPAVPWARARTNGKRYFTAPEMAAYKRAVGSIAAVAMAGRLLVTGPVVMEVMAVFAPPASWSKRKQAAAHAGEIAMIVKPDVDNLGKIILDALNGIVYVDDAQVVRATVEKGYGAAPRVEVSLRGWKS